MTEDGRPKAKTSIGEKFRDQTERLREHVARDAVAIQNKEPPEWYRPKDFESNLFDIEAMHAPFSREEYEQWFVEVVKDPDDPGTTGDLFMISIQGDWLHLMERAFKARCATPCRCRAHASARRQGHGLPDFGVIQGCLMAYIENIDKINKSEYL